MRADQRITSIWEGNRSRDAFTRALLAPFSILFRILVATRNRLYDAGVFRSVDAAVPVVSVGNLTVGGTGKTPVASHIATLLATAGARPAIVLRGYGSDEVMVHERLQPLIPVVASADRIWATSEAVTRHGANVVVLDDGFQHRRLRRRADIVLLSADQPSDRLLLLPAGPWREGLSALGRATLVVITRKAASQEQVLNWEARIRRLFPRLPIASVAIVPGQLESTGGLSRPIRDLQGARTLMIAAVGDPVAFRAQLEGAGAIVTGAVFRDHYQYTAADASRLAAMAASSEMVVCTLKDAVKLEALWPRSEKPLWYVSQSVVVERGGEHLNALKSLISTSET